MSSLSPEERQARIALLLARQRTCVISTTATQGIWAIPVRYRTGNETLEVECLVPRWADVAHYLRQNESAVVLVVQLNGRDGLRWLQVRGTAHAIESPDWARSVSGLTAATHLDGLYLALRITPERIDLVDEGLGWGIRETLEW